MLNNGSFLTFHDFPINADFRHFLFSAVSLSEKRPFFYIFLNPLSTSLLHHFSLITHRFSLPKHICFTLRKTVFHPSKDRVLECKTRSFATRNIYLWGMEGEKKGSEREVKGRKTAFFESEVTIFKPETATPILTLTICCKTMKNEPFSSHSPSFHPSSLIPHP